MSESLQVRGVYRFGIFRLDSRSRALKRKDHRIALQDKPFQLLLLLLQRPGEIVTREEVQQQLWASDTFIEFDNGLNTAVKKLRAALGDSADNPRFVETVPKRGYRFIAPLTTEDEQGSENVGAGALVPPEDEIALVGRSITQVRIEEESSETATALPIRNASPIQGSHRILLLCTAILVLAVAIAVFRPTIPPPKLLRIRQVTHIGTLVYNTYLLTDGPRIYFTMLDGHDRVIRYISPEGGESFPVQKTFPEVDLYDISPTGSEFLLVNLQDRRGSFPCSERYVRLWRSPAPSGSPQPVGEVCTHVARWSPDGRTIAYALGSDLYVVKPDGSNARKVASLPGEILRLVWAPDGSRLRLSAANARGNGATLWQDDLTTNTLQPLLPDWPSSARVWAGGWTPDGKYFFFSALAEGTTRNIWAIREHDGMLRRLGAQPTQITAGPLTFYGPTPSKDGKSVFAVGEQLRGQLVRYDKATRQFAPYAQGISADHIAFSHDGQWMAYVKFPEGFLVRSRVDGSEPRQLTFSPMRVFGPQWSPDDTRIAFQAAEQTGAHTKIYIVSSSGDLPVLATAESRDQQTYPSWASDGGLILFSSSDESDSHPVLRSLELKTKHVSELPGSAGLYWGQISPDGQHVIALEENTQRLMLYDMTAQNTRVLAKIADYPRWSADGQYVYFSTLYFSNIGEHGGIYRWKMATNKTEMLTGSPDFPLGGIWGVNFGLTPDGDILLLRDLSTRDLYALDLDLP